MAPGFIEVAQHQLVIIIIHLFICNLQNSKMSMIVHVFMLSSYKINMYLLVISLPE